MPLIVGLLMTWLAVTTDCHGNPEAFVTYEIATERIVQTGVVLCDDGTLSCPVYSRTFETFGTAQTSLWLDDPAQGGMIAWGDPVAMDKARNTSEDACLP